MTTSTVLPGSSIGSDTYYDEVLEAIKSDPESVIAEKRLDQIASLKLYIPEQIRAHRKLRRHKYEQFEAAMKETEARKIEISLEIKNAREANNKLTYANKESREAELVLRLAKDPSYNSWNKLRANYYSDYKSLSDEIDYLERIDISLLEIIAMFTAQVDRKYEKNGRSIARATRRSENGKRPGVSGKNGASPPILTDGDREDPPSSLRPFGEGESYYGRTQDH